MGNSEIVCIFFDSQITYALLRVGITFRSLRFSKTNARWPHTILHKNNIRQDRGQNLAQTPQFNLFSKRTAWGEKKLHWWETYRSIIQELLLVWSKVPLEIWNELLITSHVLVIEDRRSNSNSMKMVIGRLYYFEIYILYFEFCGLCCFEWW